MNHQETLTKPTFIQKLKKYPYRNFLYRAYKRYKLKAASYKRISMESRLKDIDILNCSTIKLGKFSAYFSEQDIAAIKSHNLDFMLRFGFNIIKGEILKKYGERVLYTKKRTSFGDYRSIEGVQDALIDLYLSGKNKTLLLSYGSSFGELQWWFGGGHSKIIMMDLHPNWGPSIP
jgi:hypothetical protein